MFCGKCGTKLNDGQQFCHKCGAPLASYSNEPGEITENNVMEQVRVAVNSDFGSRENAVKNKKRRFEKKKHEFSSNDEARAAMNAAYRGLIWKMIGVILAEIHLITLIFLFLVEPRLRETTMSEGFGTFSAYFIIIGGILINLVFVGIRRIFSISVSLITLGGTLVFTIVGIPLMIILFAFAIMIVPCFPIVGTIWAYKDEKEEFEEACDYLNILPEDADKRVSTLSLILKIVMPILAVCCVLMVVWYFRLRHEAATRPTTVTYEEDASYEDSSESDTTDNKNEEADTSAAEEPNPNRKREGEIDGFKWQAVGDEIKLTDFDEAKSESVIKIPSKIDGYPVTTLTAWLFNGNEVITDVTLPSTLTTMEAETFYNCKNLKTVTMSSGLVTIGNECFKNCESLEEIIIPDSVETIGELAFCGCTSLKRVKIDGALTIGSSAFKNCTNLESVELNEGLLIIGSDAFNKCESLREITIPGTVTEIQHHAFSQTGLEKAILLDGDEPAKIGNQAFGFTHIARLDIPGKYVELDHDVVDEKTTEEVRWAENTNGENQVLNGTLINANEKEFTFHGGATITEIKGNSLHGQMWGKPMTVYGPAGSYLEQYANEHDIPFVAE